MREHCSIFETDNFVTAATLSMFETDNFVTAVRQPCCPCLKQITLYQQSGSHAVRICYHPQLSPTKLKKIRNILLVTVDPFPVSALTAPSNVIVESSGTTYYLSWRPGHGIVDTFVHRCYTIPLQLQQPVDANSSLFSEAAAPLNCVVSIFLCGFESVGVMSMFVCGFVSVWMGVVSMFVGLYQWGW